MFSLGRKYLFSLKRSCIFKACDKKSLFALISLCFSLTQTSVSQIFIDLIYFILFSVDNHKMGLFVEGGGKQERDGAIILDLSQELMGFSFPKLVLAPR